MEPYFTTDLGTVYHGDCREAYGCNRFENDTKRVLWNTRQTHPGGI